MKVFAIIPARGGSKRIPNKNIKHFLGKEIIGYPIKALLNSKVIDKVLVSTDSDEIKGISESFGAYVPFLRSSANSDDYATTYDVIKEVAEKVDLSSYDYILCLYPTSVFVTSDLIRNAVELLSSNREATSLTTVLEYSHPIQRALKLVNGELKSIEPEYYNSRSQDLETTYHDAGQLYLFNLETVLKSKKLITNNSIPMVIPQNEAQDIDTEDDWKLAELKYKASEKS
ncbi:pseudaminic acid cytidylyltransferase [Vibrio chagasii]|uniref:pseudaminic acid cytidylyltransferase n=1 Tax=Vibrio chagasii TaxID=170679 RepID=UPI003DA89EB1